MAVVTVLLTAHAQSAIPAITPSPLRQSGTLLSQETTQLVPISTLQLWSKASESVGAVTLSSNSEAPVAGFEKTIDINSVCVSSGVTFVGDDLTRPSLYFVPSETSFDAFALAEDDTAGFEVSAVPEPSTWLTACLALAFLAWQQRRRFRFRRVP